jgi:hypothetical protein
MQHQLAPRRAAVVADKQDWQKTIVLNAPALAVLIGLPQGSGNMLSLVRPLTARL